MLRPVLFLLLAISGSDALARNMASAKRRGVPTALAGGLDRSTRGRVRGAGHELTRMGPCDLLCFRGERIGFVFQDFKLVASLTAGEVAA